MSTVTTMRGLKAVQEEGQDGVGGFGGGLAGGSACPTSHPLGDRFFGAIFARYPARDADFAGAVGDFLAELIALAELLSNDLDYVVGVAIVAGEDEGLGGLGAAGEDIGEELVAEFADDGADLVWGDHVAIELVGGVGEIGIEQFGSAGAGEAVALVDPEAGLHARAGGGDAGSIL